MENNTTSAPTCQQSNDADIGEKVGRTVALSLIMSLALIGNLLVFIVFKRNPTTRTNTNYFIVNMVASDLLFSFFMLPLHLGDIWLGWRGFLIGGPVGEFLCKFSAFMTDISTVVSAQSLVLIAVERFTAVVYPLKVKRFTSRRRTILVVVTWVVAALLLSPYFFFFRLVTINNTLYCAKDWTPLVDTQVGDKIYFTTFMIFQVHIPLLVIAVLYTLLSLKLKRMQVPGCHVGDTHEILRRKRNKRITKMSICIVIVFALCWLPYVTYLMLTYFSALPPSSLFFLVTYNLAMSNSAINPWILFYFCRNFRQGLRDMFGCCPCFSQRSNPIVTRNTELQEMRGGDVQEQ